MKRLTESNIKNHDKIKYELDAAGLGDFYLIYVNSIRVKLKNEWLNGWHNVNGRMEKETGLNQLKWPTLGEMRKQKKRIVIFSDKTEDAGYGIMHVSSTIETKYDLSSYSNCEMRSKNSEGRSLKAPIFVMNHFYGWEAVPGFGNYYDYWKQPNEFNKIAARAGICILQNGQWPNFITFDNVGDPNNADDRRIVITINKTNKEYCCTDKYLVSDSEEKSKEVIETGNNHDES